MYCPLAAQPTTIIRSIEAQTPSTKLQESVLSEVFDHFRDHPIRFEAFAARIFQMVDNRVVIDEVTRATMDGGRDAVGRYLLGLKDDPVFAEFALEAKCYRPALNDAKPNTVGVKEVSRLISRLKHRQFGVLVTTSAVARQAYLEVREDKHPVIFITGKDISEILIEHGFNTKTMVKQFLNSQFPINGGTIK
mgnify:CR=1 FL=1